MILFNSLITLKTDLKNCPGNPLIHFEVKSNNPDQSDKNKANLVQKNNTQMQRDPDSDKKQSHFKTGL